MRWLLLLLLLTSCGGGGSSSGSVPVSEPPKVAPERLSQYVGPLLGSKTHGVLTSPSGVFASEFYAEPGAIRWATSREIWEVKECAGAKYAVIRGFENTATGELYELESVRETVGGVDTTSCVGGTFTRMDFSPGVLITESWFRIWDGAHKSWRPGYWKGVFTFGGARLNPCTGETLPVVELREIWWDESGWVRGRPTNPNDRPWTDGRPVPIETNLDSVTTFALDHGVWTVSDKPGEVICLKSLTPW